MRSRRWQARYLEAGVDGLLRDKSRPPGTPPLSAAIKTLVLTKTMRETPPDATHWSVRSMARAVGISHTSVQNIWRAHGLKPHLVDSFKVSNDPAFAEKVEDVVGLYLDPPDKAVVFSVDEKSQIQALDRSQPGLPMKKGRAGTMTHDYKRHGTTTLFAALNLLDGKVIGHCMKRHRHQEFIRFLNRIDRQTLPYLDIHLIIDNYATHKTPAVKRWLKKHPRFHIHFTPTSASWLNMVERFFAEITRKRIRRGVFKSVAELEQAIYDYLAIHNHNPVPFAALKCDHPDDWYPRIARRGTSLLANPGNDLTLMKIFALAAIDAFPTPDRKLPLAYGAADSRPLLRTSPW